MGSGKKFDFPTLGYFELDNHSHNNHNHSVNLNCRRCGYEWIPKTDRVPKECPDCKSRRWMDGDTGIRQADSRAEVGRKGNREPVPDLRETEDQSDGLHSLQSVWPQLAIRRGSELKSASEQGTIPDVEEEVCGERRYNENDGNWYLCGVHKHGPKTGHGKWILDPNQD